MAPLPEIPRRQRDMVDTCFEEQLFDGGLGIMDRIRTPDAIPSQQHIRQLLYLALYPPVTERKEIKKPVVKRNNREKKQVGEVPPPDRAVSDLSLKTLYHFVRTNDARELLRSIPSYDRTPDDEGGVGTNNRLAFHAECIIRVKHCWEILCPDYILPESCASAPSTRSKLVADHAWGVFDWLVEAFEREAVKERGVSPTLLSQLPKSGGGPRIMMNTPLDIIVASFAEPLDQRRIDSAARLMAMLVALTSTKPALLSPDRLLSETCRRLAAMDKSSFSTFMAKLDDLRFKSALACAFLSQHSETGVAAPGVANHRQHQQPTATRVGPGEKAEDTVQPGSAYAIPPVERVLEIIRLNVRVQEDLAGGEEEDEDTSGSLTAGDQTLKHATMKLHLLGSIGGLGLWQSRTWRAAVREGKFGESIRVGFLFGDGSDEGLAAIGYTAAAFGDCWLMCL